LEKTFPKNQIAFQLAPMVACILLFFSLKNKRYCQPAGKWFAENQCRFALDENLNFKWQNKAIFKKKSQMSNYICGIIKLTNGKDFQ